MPKPELCVCQSAGAQVFRFVTVAPFDLIRSLGFCKSCGAILANRYEGAAAADVALHLAFVKEARLEGTEDPRDWQYPPNYELGAIVAKGGPSKPPREQTRSAVTNRN